MCQACGVNQVTSYSRTVWNLQEVRFYERHQPFYELTNFFPVDLTIGGAVYPTSEHYFQASKFLMTAPQVADQIRRSPRPRDAFDVAHQNVRFERPDWLVVRDNVMLEALRYKYENPYLRACLLITGTRRLIEHTVNDKYWGNGGNDTGVNRLGQLLMQVREEIARFENIDLVTVTAKALFSKESSESNCAVM